MQAAGGRNKAAAQEFLAKNGKEKGVQTTASGLEYKVIKAGDSKIPLIGPTDEVVVNYRGKLIDGTEFDSSYSHGQPATMTRQRRHQRLAGSAGDDAAGCSLGAVHSARARLRTGPAARHSREFALIFDIEIVSAKPKPAAAAPAPLPVLPGT